MAGATDVIKDLFQKADDLHTEKELLLKDIGHNREALRTLKNAGALSAEQAKKVDDLYPPRTRANGETDTTAAAAA